MEKITNRLTLHCSDQMILSLGYCNHSIYHNSDCYRQNLNFTFRVTIINTVALLLLKRERDFANVSKLQRF
jgi:hypothetical protein